MRRYGFSPFDPTRAGFQCRTCLSPNYLLPRRVEVPDVERWAPAPKALRRRASERRIPAIAHRAARPHRSLSYPRRRCRRAGVASPAACRCPTRRQRGDRASAAYVQCPPGHRTATCDDPRLGRRRGHFHQCGRAKRQRRLPHPAWRASNAPRLHPSRRASARRVSAIRAAARSESLPSARPLRVFATLLTELAASRRDCRRHPSPVRTPRLIPLHQEQTPLVPM